MIFSQKKAQKIRKTTAVAGLAVVAFVFFSGIQVVFAADTTEYKLLTTIPYVGTTGSTANPISVVKNIYGISIGIAAVLAVAMIIWGGVEYATQEAITGKSDAKDRIQGAIYGMILLLASYIILRTINIDLVNINLDLGNPVVGDTTAGSLTDVLKNSSKSVTDFENAKEAIKTIAAAASSTSALLQQKIDSLKSNASSTSAQINSAIAQKTSTDAENSQQIDIAKTILSMTDPSGYGLAYSSDQIEVSKKRAAFIANMSAIMAKLVPLDNAEAQVYWNVSTEQLKELDAAILKSLAAKVTGCQTAKSFTINNDGTMTCN